MSWALVEGAHRSRKAEERWTLDILVVLVEHRT